MSSQTIKTWWGNFEKEELKKFAILAITFGFTIGVYWLLRGLKDTVFMTTARADNIPLAKWVSLFVVLPLGIFYSKLVDMFPRHKVFYALAIIYSTLALMFAFFFWHPVLGLKNIIVTTKGAEIMSEHALFFGRMLGWAWYVFVESFGSIMVVLFWGFAADTTTPESAKRGFPILTFGAQVGGIMGPALAAMYTKQLGIPVLALIASVATLGIGAMIWYFMRVVPKEQLTGFKEEGAAPEKKPKTGFMEGIRLMVSQPYLLAIFMVISLYEIINTILDFNFKYLASQQGFSAEELGAYLGKFGVYTNTMALICVAIGINNIGRKLGLRTALIVLPVLMLGIIAYLYANPTLQAAFWILVVAKALNYALNQPTKEQLYVPTTREAKYKAKAFIEMYGSRGSKAAGSAINMFKKVMTPDMFILFISGASVGLIFLWIYISIFLGNTHKKAVEENKAIC